MIKKSASITLQYDSCFSPFYASEFDKGIEWVKNCGFDAVELIICKPKEIKINEILELELGTQGIKTAGRIITIRRMGRLTFAHLVDFSDQIQISFSESTLSKKKYKEFSLHPFKKLVLNLNNKP